MCVLWPSLKRLVFRGYKNRAAGAGRSGFRHFRHMVPDDPSIALCSDADDFLWWSLTHRRNCSRICWSCCNCNFDFLFLWKSHCCLPAKAAFTEACQRPGTHSSQRWNANVWLHSRKAGRWSYGHCECKAGNLKKTSKVFFSFVCFLPSLKQSKESNPKIVTFLHFNGPYGSPSKQVRRPVRPF